MPNGRLNPLCYLRKIHIYFIVTLRSTWTCISLVNAPEVLAGAQEPVDNPVDRDNSDNC